MRKRMETARTISKGNIEAAYIDGNIDEADRIEMFGPLNQYHMIPVRQSIPEQFLAEPTVHPAVFSKQGEYIWSDVIE